MLPTIYILNGPNLNMLGQRQPEIYGSTSLAQIEQNCHNLVKGKFNIEFRQTNHEGILIDWVQEAKNRACALLLNAGGLTHTSVSLYDALIDWSIPIYEIHLSQPYKREPFRHNSFISPTAHAIVAGFGANGYTIVLQYLLEHTPQAQKSQEHNEV